MERHAIISALLHLPAWPVLGLSTRDERMRERSAEAIAVAIVARVEGRERPGADQLALPL